MPGWQVSADLQQWEELTAWLDGKRHAALAARLNGAAINEQSS
jgi:hypothetical protein